MKIVVLLFIFFNIAFSCSGDCIKCHPSLKKNGVMDDNHKILENCITCHKITDNELEKMGSLCGQDCWDCHNVKKVSDVKIKGEFVKEHLVLNDCINCHKKLDSTPFYLNKIKEKSIFLIDKK
jgi:hypothetical protein